MINKSLYLLYCFLKHLEMCLIIKDILRSVITVTALKLSAKHQRLLIPERFFDSRHFQTHDVIEDSIDLGYTTSDIIVTLTCTSQNHRGFPSY